MRVLLASFVLVAACRTRHEPAPRPPVGSAATQASPAAFDRIARADFNRYAVRLDLSVFWMQDRNGNHAIDPDEVAALLFYPTEGHWVAGGTFTPAFRGAYEQIVSASKAPAPTDPRLALVDQELDQGRSALVRTDLTGAPAEDRRLVEHMLTVAQHIDAIYLRQNGAAALASRVPADPASQSLFRRNRGPVCAAPKTANDPQCSAIPGSPKPAVDVYPAALQTSPTFCKDLEARHDAGALLGHFTVVKDDGGKLAAVPYSDAYQDEMSAVSRELSAAADDLKDPGGQPLATYLRAASKSFVSNDWVPADEAWSRMNADNSRWYVRVAPDEVYWEPCRHKAGFHLTFARIDQSSKKWQQKLVPVQQDMEAAIAARAGAPYQARKVAFHLPDFIDIVINAGNDRVPLGGTAGESLPNWGPVASEGRGRTVAMVNVFGDPDSLEIRDKQAASLLDAASAKLGGGGTEPGLLVTILHEASHNLGPANEYRVGGQTDEQRFGGPVASVFEELKAQTGALFLVEFLRAKGLVPDELAHQAYAYAIWWMFEHVSDGMYYPDHSRNTYANVAAAQLGFLIEHGAVTWDAGATAANGTDHGAFVIHTDKLVGVIDDMLRTVAGIKARGDKAAAAALLARYVDGTIIPQQVIRDRFLRFPGASLIYSVAP